MKKIRVSVCAACAAVLALVVGVMGCHDGSDDDDPELEQDSLGKTVTDDYTPSASVVRSVPYFWGTWVRMDNGDRYVINETSVQTDTNTYTISSSSDTTLSASSLRFTKQSNQVMVDGSQIPYFRKGGANLNYKLKLVGFTGSSAARAATSSSVSGLGGLNVVSRSETYTSYTSSDTSNASGDVTLTAPVQGDSQRVTVTTRDGRTVVVPGLTVQNNDDNLGSVPIVDAGEYSLKITGVIPSSETDDGYLYGDNYKGYNMELTITNISDVTSAPAAVAIRPKDSVLNLSSAEGDDLNGIPVSTMKPGAKKTIRLRVSYGTISSEEYVDTAILVSVTNMSDLRTWEDYVPLRFFKGRVPITIAAYSFERNVNATLNGFIIYPDGNSQFFTVGDRNGAVLYVPAFGSSSPYKLAFSGATVDGELSQSTEMFYTVNPGSTTAWDIVSSGSDIADYMGYAEPNDTEDTAWPVSGSFEACIVANDIDFYSISITR